MQGGQVVVAGVAVADQDTGESGQHSAVVDVLTAAATDMHQRQIFGAGDIHVGQCTIGAADGFVGMQHRHGGEQLFHVRRERGNQFGRGAAAGPGPETGRQVQTGQRFQ